MDHAHYWENLKKALEQSRYLIVLCSPNSAKSGPVDLEVRHFLATHEGRVESVVPVMFSGGVIPHTEENALCTVLIELGDRITNRNLPSMIPDAGAPTRGGWENGFLGLVSYLLQIPVTTLSNHIRREERRQVARTRALALLFALIACAAVAGGIVAWQKSELAKKEKEAAQISDKKARAQLKEASRSDFATAQQRLAEGKWQEAVAYLGRSIRYDHQNENAQIALWLALRYGQRDAPLMPSHSFRHPKINSMTLNADCSMLLTTGGDKGYLWNIKSPQAEPIILQHSHVVYKGDFSKDGTMVATPSADKTGRIWNTRNGQPIGPPLVHEQSVFLAKFSPGGESLLTLSDEVAKVWEVKKLQHPPLEFRPTARINYAEFSPDGKRIVTASFDHTVQIWDAKTGERLGAPLRHNAEVNLAKFSHDGTMIVSCSRDSSARLWRVIDGQPIGNPLAHDANVFFADFSADDSLVVTGGTDRTARVWNTQSTNMVSKPILPPGHVSDARFSPDGAFIITAAATARVWDARTGRPIGGVLAHDHPVSEAAFASDKLVMTMGDHEVNLWRRPTREAGGIPLVHAGLINSAVFAPDGASILTSGDDHVARRWNVKDSNEWSLFRHTDLVNDATFSPDGKFILTASEDKTARLWDVSTGTATGQALVHPAPVYSAEFDVTSSKILTTSTDHKGRVWDLQTGQPIELSFHTEAILSAKFSSDGQRIVTSSRDMMMRVWKTNDGTAVGPPCYHAIDVWTANFSHDRKRIVTGSRYMARVWDAETGKLIGKPIGHKWDVRSACFSKDGTKILTADTRQSAQLWLSSTGESIGLAMEHENGVNFAKFSHDESFIVTGGNDKTARRWDSFGRSVGPAFLHPFPIFSGELSRDQSKLLTFGKDRCAYVWDLSPRTRLSAEMAESVAIVCSGMRLEPNFGLPELVKPSQRTLAWEMLKASLPDGDDWRFVAELTFEQNADTARMSPSSTVSIRDCSRRLLERGDLVHFTEVYQTDPTYAVVPFAISLGEVQNSKEFERNPTRAAWLIDDGLKRLPANTAALDLRIAAHLIAKVAEILPEQKPKALDLLNRALKLDPNEDEGMKKLRESLK